MKTYDEMTQSVLQRRDAYVVRQKWRRTQLTAICAGVCLLAGLGVGVWQKAKRLPTAPADSSSPTLTVTTQPISVSMQSQLYLASDGKQTLLEEGIGLPQAYAIAVRDIRELSEKEVEEAFEQERDAAQDTAQEIVYNNEIPYHVNTMRRDNAIISTVWLGDFELQIDNPEEVASISGKSSSEYGRVEFYANSDSISKEDYGPYSGSELTLSGDYYRLLLQEEEDGTGRLMINWRPSPQLYDAIDADPTLPLSFFSDVFVLGVEYKDGSWEEHVVEIAFTDDGEANLNYWTEDVYTWGEVG